MIKKVCEQVFYGAIVLGAFTIIGLLTHFVDGI